LRFAEGNCKVHRIVSPEGIDAVKPSPKDEGAPLILSGSM
jgi:hypothetical protein